MRAVLLPEGPEGNLWAPVPPKFAMGFSSSVAV
jgi:hypothetical protein